jgi:hypothetical protein
MRGFDSPCFDSVNNVMSDNSNPLVWGSGAQTATSFDLAIISIIKDGSILDSGNQWTILKSSSDVVY